MTSTRPGRASNLVDVLSESIICGSKCVRRFLFRGRPATARPNVSRMLQDVMAGLRESPKTVSSKYLYDRRGSALFDEICELPEYYLTKTELRIMRKRADEIARRIGSQAILIEPGSGSSLKTRLLIERLEDLAAYVPIDISGKHLMAAVRRLTQKYPAIEILPVVGDFTQPLEMPTPTAPARRRVVYFPGSTIGNFTHGQAIRLLSRISELAGQGGGVVLGFDLKKDPAVIHAAYNDSQGVTAAFNLNLLHRLNRDLGADFDVDQFAHDAPYDSEKGRVTMTLISRRQQQVCIAGQMIQFAEGEPIITEYCHKYDIEQMRELARRARLKMVQTWTDPKQWFAISYFEVLGTTSAKRSIAGTSAKRR